MRGTGARRGGLEGLAGVPHEGGHAGQGRKGRGDVGDGARLRAGRRGHGAPLQKGQGDPGGPFHDPVPAAVGARARHFGWEKIWFGENLVRFGEKTRENGFWAGECDLGRGFHVPARGSDFFETDSR